LPPSPSPLVSTPWSRVSWAQRAPNDRPTVRREHHARFPGVAGAAPQDPTQNTAHADHGIACQPPQGQTVPAMHIAERSMITPINSPLRPIQPHFPTATPHFPTPTTPLSPSRAEPYIQRKPMIVCAPRGTSPRGEGKPPGSASQLGLRLATMQETASRPSQGCGGSFSQRPHDLLIAQEAAHLRGLPGGYLSLEATVSIVQLRQFPCRGHWL
jgi:hypothetical protein